VIAVFKHEIRNYFHTMTAYVFGAFLLAFTGMGATLYNLQAAVSNFEFVLSFGSLIFVVIVPVLTMRVIAEEKNSGQTSFCTPFRSPPPRWSWENIWLSWWSI